MDVLAADAVFFTLAISLAAALASVELFALLLGMSPSSAIRQRLGGSSDAADKKGSAPPRRYFGWLTFGNLPALIMLALLLSLFGTLGLLEQWSAKHLLGLSLHPLIAAIPAAIAALLLCNGAGRIISRLTQAESHGPHNVNFVGRIATLTLGAATVGRPARARLVDLEGRAHQVLVEPVDVNQTLPEGSEVIVVRQEGSILRVTTHPDSAT